eukprot:TRINITY_DN59378_c0_g1_i1.p2 TRINITY_DN59378_c0_g1~~TRINITY_DN59378_c0_g1_i1.p2  ORF type:complete len:285 (+),score=106.63 TRINITY_DN59378_c0_g1_i1:220-1074(+)
MSSTAVLLDMAKDVTAGAIGGAAGICVGQPFDVVKTKLQLGARAASQKAESAAAIFTATLRSEGVTGLWRGLAPQLWGVMLYQGVCFTSYNIARKGLSLLESEAPIPEAEDSMERAVMAGVFAGATCTVVVTPIDAYKVALQVRSMEAKTLPRGALLSLVREGSVRPYNALSATVMRDVPSTGAYFYVYEKMRRHYGFSSFHAGGIAGAVSWGMCSPFDIIKTRIQASKAPTTVPKVVREVYAESGMRGFTRGMLTLMVRGYPVHGVTFAVFSSVEAHLQKLDL